MPLYDVYERDGAVFRAPANQGYHWVTEVQLSNGSWAKYEGQDPMKPVVFGDYLGQRRYPEHASQASK